MDITIPDISRDSDRGQVGIETLIIFIAMILVAAIAASVLINTAGYLQNQASATSEDSEAQVSNQVLVLSSIGEIHTDTEVQTETGVNFAYDNTSGSPLLNYSAVDGDLTFTSDKGDLYVETQADDGSTQGNETITDSQDLSLSDTYDVSGIYTESTTAYVEVNWVPNEGSSQSWNITLTSGSSEDTATAASADYPVRVNTDVSDVSMTVMQSPGANEIDLEGASVEYIGPDGEATLSYAEASGVGQFAVEGTTDPDGTVPVLTSRQDRFTLHIELSSSENSDLRYLQEGEEATIRIVTQSGSQAVTVVNVPQSLSSYDSGDAVEL